MRLLVSVRSAVEIEAALKGGADIVDAKEPARGPLGAVTARTLAAIARRVPFSIPLSVALGDLTTPEQVRGAIHAIALSKRSTPIYAKIGFAGVRSADRVAELIETAVAVASSAPPGVAVIAVAYADHERAGAPAPMTVATIAARAGARGILVDTWLKDGRGLLAWMPPATLVSWCDEQRGAGLLTALAGSLTEKDVSRVASGRPDVIGVRGAACDYGREGRISQVRVERIKRLLESGVALSS